MIASSTGLVVFVGALIGGAYLYVNSQVSGIHRIPVAALDAKEQSTLLGQSGMTVLLTDTGAVPGAYHDAGVVELLHLNASGHGGAVVSIPANAVVSVPGHGRMEIGHTLAVGGPSLMVETIERLTDIRISHYSAIDLASLPEVVGAMHGVNVDVPYATTSMGYKFHAGINHLTSADALAYARQPAVSEVGREELQENLIRTIMDKIASHRYFVATNWHVLHAVVNAVSVDSNFTNSQLEHLALSLGRLKGRDGTFVDAQVRPESPTRGDDQPVRLRSWFDEKIWRAVRQDSVAQLARRYPFIVTPNAPA